MKMCPVPTHRAASNSVIPVLFLAGIIFILLQPSSVLWAQYEVKNDRILAPEVTHFTRPSEPGVDSHGDLSLSIPLITVPGRDGLDFNIVANYRSGIQVTQSASWIGLGWELDVGSITRHPLGGINNHEQADFARGIAGDGYTVLSQPDVYSVNMNGNSTLLISNIDETDPSLPFDPAASSELGPCSTGLSASPWYFIPSPWRPWKICYGIKDTVVVDGEKTNVNGNIRKDFNKFVIRAEDGTRYVYDVPTLAHAYFPPGQSDYTFASTWRLRAILSPNYSGPDVPNGSSTGGWVKIVYKAWDRVTDSAEPVETVKDHTLATTPIISQLTYPYYVETPTHFALFTTSKRYDRDLAVFITGSLYNGNASNYYSRKLDKIALYKNVSIASLPKLLWRKCGHFTKNL